MDVGSFAEAVAQPHSEVALTLADLPLDELLLSLHTGRFTGGLRVGTPPDADRLCFRDGAFVGMRPRPSADGPGLQDALLALKLATAEGLSAVSDDGACEARELAKRLVHRRLLSEADVQRAVGEHARRRLFKLYDLSVDTSVRVKQGLDQLADFWPVSIDVRPIVAFGMVVRADAPRRARMLEKVKGRSIRLLSPYDEHRNSYGLPPPVVFALKFLEDGMEMTGTGELPGLSLKETAGVLLLLDRMALLRVE